MKKILSILFVTCIALTIQAQKCKFDFEKKDPFTGKTTIGITATLEKAWKIGFNRSENDYLIGLAINFAGVKEGIINKGDTLMIALENGEPIILIASDKALPTSDVVGSGGYEQIQTWYQPRYIPNSEQMRQFSLEKVIAIRVYFGTVWYMIEISSKNAEKIIKAASCILK